jgi:hypothetical protein
MKALTIRGLDFEVAEKLKATASKKGKSVNQFILEMIETNLGFKKEKKYSREYKDLDDLFGRWSDDEFIKIHDKIERERQVDQELWK